MKLEKIQRELDALTLNSPIDAGNGCHALPNRKEVVDLIKDLQSLLFPECFKSRSVTQEGLCGVSLLRKIENEIVTLIEKTAAFSDAPPDAAFCAEAFLSRLPHIKALLLKDVEALYEGDPAARSREEVLLCYPGFYAISIYRLAHELYLLKVPMIPRIMTEYAHEKTGVDIHAGATVGEYFFIDHGTGIVVGETTVIGDHVKLYQGVTLGAKSFELDENGNPIKNIKRHPNIGNHVVIYANATILGGRTFVGDGCVIGASVWLTRSVEAGKTLYYTPPQTDDAPDKTPPAK
ncbi:MAG: serine acetyltransferase [Clostridia bacterium]|nr:serine acetyltransferase [Clostridia bacterium]